MAYKDLPIEEQEVIARAYAAGQHLYFIKAKKINLIKIGIAQDPVKRLRDLQVGSPVELKLIYVLPFGGYMIESKLHKQFKHLRSRGEWFEYNAEVREVIKDIKTIIREHKWTRYANKLLRG